MLPTERQCPAGTGCIEGIDHENGTFIVPSPVVVTRGDSSFGG